MITLERLGKDFEVGQQTLVAVESLSIHVDRGEVFGLLGPNGAGKTTTLRMILGLLRPTRGDVLIDGENVTEHPLKMKQQIGLVSASAGLYQWLTTYELLEFFGRGFGLTKEQTVARIDELSQLMELKRFLHQRTATLSTGQKQRVNLARALMHDPPVVLLDEPTRGLDVVGSQVVFDFTAHLRSLGKAIIVSTHQLDEAERLCDRFGLLYRGQLRYEGTMPQLRASTGRSTLVEIFLDLLREPATQEAANASAS